MVEVPDFMKEDADVSAPKIKEENLNSISSVAERIVEMQEKIEMREDILKKDKAELRVLTDDRLPELMNEAGMKKFVMKNGAEISVKKIYSFRPKVENKKDALRYLEENGHYDIIKNTVSIDFGKGEDETAQKFKTLALQENLPIQEDSKVHPMTGKAWAKEQIEKGVSLPEFMGVTVIDHATIKGGKQ